MYPIKLSPVFKDYLWGGKNLYRDFNKKTNLNIVAESWELSCCKDGLSIVENGIFEGQTLLSILQKNQNFIGNKFHKDDQFPLLVKLIDAKKDLSIQVHPSDELADKSKGEQGKTEMWYILDCDEGAYIYLGTSKDMSEAQLLRHLESGTICNCLNKVYVKPGDYFMIEAGTVHAICAGIVIAEIQQNSNTTFRLFDYDRKDLYEKKRELHIEDAIRVSNLNKYDVTKNSPNNFYNSDEFLALELVDCNYFKVYKLDIKKYVDLNIGNDSFNAILFIDGKGEIIYDNKCYLFQKGDCYFLPAGLGKCTINGKCECIVSKI